MSAIEFVVRDSAGNLQRGSLGDGASNSVIVGVDEQVSLNLIRAQIQGYERQGQALQITLVSGEIILLEGFFAADGIPENQLFVSSNGTLDEVELVAGTDGAYYPNYAAYDSFGKWSPEDDLYFVRGSEVQLAGYDAYVPPADDQAGMLAVPLLTGLGGIGGGGLAAAAGLVGAGVVVGGGHGGGGGGNGGGGGGNGGGGGGGGNGGGGGGGNGSGGVAVAITSGTGTDEVVNTSDYADGVELGGTGTVGATVTVNLAGATQTTVVDTTGHWSVVFPSGSVPDGTYSSTATVTAVKGSKTTTVSDTVYFDTEASVTLVTATVERDGIVNGAEASDGVVLTGTVERGSSVVVTVEGVNYTAQVTGTNWSVNVPSVASGEYTLPISVSATDAYGNSASASGSVRVDTYVNSLTVINTVEGDDRVNGAEASDGIVFSGSVEPGSSVMVTYQGPAGTAPLTLPATVTGGTWSVNFAGAQIPAGEYTGQITVRGTDAAGNISTVSDTFQVDTFVNNLTENQPVEGDDRVNGVEASDGIPLSGTVEAGSTVVVTFNGPAGSQPVILPAQVVGTTWSVTVPAGSIPGGEYTANVSIKATDSFGNVRTVTDTFAVDTFVNTLTHPGRVEGNDIVNAAEASDGITLTGAVEAGSNVVVTYQGPAGTAPINLQATVTGTTWSVTYPAGAIPGGEYTANISIKATDSFGNVKTITDSFVVDTVAPDAPFITEMREGRGELRSIAVSDEDTSLQVFSVDANGGTHALTFATSHDLQYDEVDLSFTAPVANGTTLVINSTDAAGNQSGTLFVYDTGAAGDNTVHLTNPGLAAFNISSIDLGFAEDAALTLTPTQLQNLSHNTNTVTIHGGVDDTLTMVGATFTGNTTVIEGTNYDIYTLGSDGTVIVDEDIKVVL